MDNRPIGIFDSGLGGLTASRELSALMPLENIIYFGDSYNMPYGEKSPERIIEMSRDILHFLLERDVKAVFIACGSATSAALEPLTAECPVPVFGVVEAAVTDALAATKNGRIGLLATRSSIAAGAFERLIFEHEPSCHFVASACPKYATMVEDGITSRHDPRVRAATAEYLPRLKAAQVDTIILGCTHYPILADVILDYMGQNVKLISSGAAAALGLCNFIRGGHQEAEREVGKTEYYTSGDLDSFAAAAKHMLGTDISSMLTKIPPFCFDKKGEM